MSSSSSQPSSCSPLAVSTCSLASSSANPVKPNVPLPHGSQNPKPFYRLSMIPVLSLSMPPAFIHNSYASAGNNEKPKLVSEFGSIRSTDKAGYGFGQQGEKAAGLRWFILQRPEDSLPRYASPIPPHSPPTAVATSRQHWALLLPRHRCRRVLLITTRRRKRKMKTLSITANALRLLCSSPVVLLCRKRKVRLCFWWLMDLCMILTLMLNNSLFLEYYTSRTSACII